ncbi:hypothetical protein RB195_003670 [Necator americanus]|uniref:Uncharacterized protein n=1 Tax=Necator americanus TaxID=51031 RepID=A0ABR1DR47_NECAM
MGALLSLFNEEVKTDDKKTATDEAESKISAERVWSGEIIQPISPIPPNELSPAALIEPTFAKPSEPAPTKLEKSDIEKPSPEIQSAPAVMQTPLGPEKALVEKATIPEAKPSLKKRTPPIEKRPTEEKKATSRKKTPPVKKEPPPVKLHIKEETPPSEKESLAKEDQPPRKKTLPEGSEVRKEKPAPAVVIVAPEKKPSPVTASAQLIPPAKHHDVKVEKIEKPSSTSTSQVKKETEKVVEKTEVSAQPQPSRSPSKVVVVVKEEKKEVIETVTRTEAPQVLAVTTLPEPTPPIKATPLKHPPCPERKVDKTQEPLEPESEAATQPTLPLEARPIKPRESGLEKTQEHSAEKIAYTIPLSAPKPVMKAPGAPPAPPSTAQIGVPTAPQLAPAQAKAHPPVVVKPPPLLSKPDVKLPKTTEKKAAPTSLYKRAPPPEKKSSAEKIATPTKKSSDEKLHTAEKKSSTSSPDRKGSADRIITPGKKSAEKIPQRRKSAERVAPPGRRTSRRDTKSGEKIKPLSAMPSALPMSKERKEKSLIKPVVEPKKEKSLMKPVAEPKKERSLMKPVVEPKKERSLMKGVMDPKKNANVKRTGSKIEKLTQSSSSQDTRKSSQSTQPSAERTGSSGSKPKKRTSIMLNPVEPKKTKSAEKIKGKLKICRNVSNVFGNNRLLSFSAHLLSIVVIRFSTKSRKKRRLVSIYILCVSRSPPNSLIKRQ